MEFRIKEHNDKFIVEIKEIKEKRCGFFSRKKVKVETWKRCTEQGHGYYSFYMPGMNKPCTNESSLLPIFKTLDEAKKAIDKIINYKETKPIYHKYP